MEEEACTQPLSPLPSSTSCHPTSPTHTHMPAHNDQHQDKDLRPSDPVEASELGVVKPASAGKVTVGDSFLLQVTALKATFRINYLKIFLAVLGCIGCVWTIPFIRLRFAGHNRSPPSSALLWTPSNICAIYIVLYIWQIATQNSFALQPSVAVYRLRYRNIRKIMLVTNTILMGLRECFVSKDPLKQFTDSSQTYKIVSILGWIVFFTSLYVLVPWYLVFQNPEVKPPQIQWSTVRLLMCSPFPIWGLASTVYRDATGNGVLLTYSILLLFVWVALLGWHTAFNHLQYDVGYIIISGVLVISLQFVAGGLMLYLFFFVNTVFGQLGILWCWKLFVYFVRKLVNRTGAFATNSADASAFSFTILLAGDLYSLLCFIVVRFNTVNFWLLICLQSAWTIFFDGGTFDVLESRVTRNLELWWKRMSGGIAEQRAEEESLEETCRIMFYQWRLNDMTMVSRSVSLCVTISAVWMEIRLHDNGVGSDSITYGQSDSQRRSSLYSYIVMILALTLAHIVARKIMLGRLQTLKKEVVSSHYNFHNNSSAKDTGPVSDFDIMFQEVCSENLSKSNNNWDETPEMPEPEQTANEKLEGDITPDIKEEPQCSAGKEEDFTLGDIELAPTKNASNSDNRASVSFESVSTKTSSMSPTTNTIHSQGPTPRIIGSNVVVSRLITDRNAKIKAKIVLARKAHGMALVEHLKQYETHEIDKQFWARHCLFFFAIVVYSTTTVLYRATQLAYSR